MPPPENSRAAQALSFQRLGNLQVAVLDYDIPSAQMTRKVLSAMGVTQTFLFRNSETTWEHIAEQAPDMLLAAYESRPEGGVAFTRRLRGRESPNRMLPIMLTTTTNTPDALREGINAGATEIIIKPFNARSIAERLTAMIDQPRAFLLTHDYVGPDRRRSPGLLPPEGERRGKGGFETAPIAITKDLLKETFIDKRPRIIPADFSLKQKLEAAASRMAGLENLLPQAEVARMEEDFVQWMLMDVNAMRKSQQQLAAHTESSRESDRVLENINKSAMSLRTRALPAGYALAARIATALHDFCQKRFDPTRPQHLVVVSKHIDTLQAILNNKITGDSSPIARQLAEELKILVDKYR